MTQTSITNTEIIPQRVAPDHYKTQSFTDPNKSYDQHLDYNLKRWNCNCPDFDYHKNLNCKHIILLRAYIKKASQAPAPEQHHSSSAELIQVLTRIAKLEGAVSSLETEQHLVERDLEEHDSQLDVRTEQHSMLLGRLTGRELQIDKMQKQLNLQHELIGRLQETKGQQAKQIERLMDLVGALQTSVCKLNERTIAQDETIKHLKNDLQDYINMTEEQRLEIIDQAQQIDHLHEAVSSQTKQTEQVVRIVVDQPAQAPKQARQERQPAEDPAVKQVSKTECKVGKFTVRIQGNCAAGCDCSIGIMDRQCGHMVKVDQFLSK